MAPPAVSRQFKPGTASVAREFFRKMRGPESRFSLGTKGREDYPASWRPVYPWWLSSISWNCRL